MKLALALVVAGGLTYKTGSTVLGGAAGVIAYIACSWRLIRAELRPRRRGWWAETNLVDALQTAGILPTLKPGQHPHRLRRRGQPQTTDAGTAVTIELPPGIPFPTAATKQPQLAAALRVPLAQLQVTQKPTDPANVARIWVGAGTIHTDHRRSPLATTNQTRWERPVEVGLDRGKPVTLATYEHNTLVGGEPGSGKTTFGRLVIGHYLLDPNTLIYGLDGKGSRKDYKRVAGLAQRWVWGNSETAATDTLAMFRELLDMVRTRNAVDDDGDGIPDVGVLLVLEEFQDIRQSAPRHVRDEIDGVLGQIIRMARAIGFHILISTQRPSVDDIPSGQRNLVNQRAALKLPDQADYKLVLGHTSKLPAPTRRGDAIVRAGGGDRAVVVDYLNNDDWRDLCARAAELRRPLPRPSPTVEVEATPPSPLEQAVIDVLTVTPELSPTALHAALPDAVRPATPAVLGKALARSGRVESYRHFERGRLWRLTESGRRESAGIS